MDSTQPRRFQFGLRDMAWTVLAAALIAGWLADRRAMDARLAEVESSAQVIIERQAKELDTLKAQSPIRVIRLRRPASTSNNGALLVPEELERGSQFDAIRSSPLRAADPFKAP